MLFKNFTTVKRIGKLSRNIRATDISVSFSAGCDKKFPLDSPISSSSQFFAACVSHSSNDTIGGPPESMLDCRVSSRMVPQSRLRISVLN